MIFVVSNNNSGVIKRLSARTLASSKSRNIIAVIAIVLTTFMITSVFSIGVSFMNNAAVMTDRLHGTTADITLTHPTQSQCEEISALKGVTDVGIQYGVGSVKGKTAQGKDMLIAVLNYDSSEWENHIVPTIGNIEGKYPSAKNEIMLSEKALDQLGITSPTLGMTVNLTFRCNGENFTMDFILSGWYTEYESIQTSGLALISDTLKTELGLTAQEDGKLSVSVSNRWYLNDAVNSVYELKTDSQTVDAPYDNTKTQMAVGGLAAIVAVALFIVLSGYLLIYNIMYISVTRDINFYGLLKTIGTSPRQIRKIVNRQGLLLSAIGIPIGLILGALVSFAVVPVALTLFGAGSDSAMPSDVSFSPLIFIGTALFALLTVMVSCRKPAKIAGRVSPVEAVKYTGVAYSGKKNIKKASRGNKLAEMAYHNVFRDKKRAFIVFTSLFMGVITFLSVFSFFDAMDIENFVSKYYKHDFVFENTPPFEDKFDSEFINSIKQTEGVESVEIVRYLNADLTFDEKYFEPVLRDSFNTYADTLDVESYDEFVGYIKKIAEKQGYTTNIMNVPDRVIEEYNKSHDDKIDIDDFKAGKTCIVAYGDYPEFIGKTIDYTINGEKHSAKIVASVDYGVGMDYGQFSYAVGSLQTVFVSEDFFNTLGGGDTVLNVAVDVNRKDEPAVEKQMYTLKDTITNTAFTFKSKSDARDEFRSSMRTTSILTGGIGLMLILIGIINFVNVMMTSVYARRMELAVLESIGMTKKQIMRMLTLEGFVYAIVSALLIGTLGTVIVSLIGSAAKQLADYAVFNFPTAEVIGITAAIFVICLIVPPLIYKLTATKTVTERLRSTDS